MKILIDTNVLLVSISSRSPYHWIFKRLIQKKFQLIISNEILYEYGEIIQKHMGNRVAENILATIESLDKLILASPSFRFNLITKDYDDNKFVDCAIAANADFILTEDNHFQELKQIDFPKVNIIGIKDFQSLFS
jgi:putative PIN family toxin of toxin-antitoxin system